MENGVFSMGKIMEKYGNNRSMGYKWRLRTGENQ